MKIIKKIAAIMLSVMMVLGMCSVVGAEENTTSGTSATNDGKITIRNAVPKQTYTIYRILELESFSDKTAENKGNYAYKATSKWKEFVESETGKTYLETDGSGYVTWVKNADPAAFAKAALAYAKNSTKPIAAEESKNAPDATVGSTTSTVTFENLGLGYYLVDSSVGALCSLDTTAKEVEIKEKNGVPSVEKKVQEDSDNHWDENNTADIGQTVNFQTTITAQAGAQNYVLHDKMDAGLTFGEVESVKVGETLLALNTDYTVEKSPTDNCTFHITFTPTYCESIKDETTIIVTYSATLNENAVIAGEGNKNETWLKYGDASETTHDTTTTKTYAIPVLKYTDKDGAETPLAGAVFELYRDEACTSAKQIKLINKGKDSSSNYDLYRIATSYETGTVVNQITTSADGKFKIYGLDADTYYLKEVTPPAGYNKLKAPVKIEITSDGKIKVDDGGEQEATNPVKVENKTGSILPSTGGMGTTLFYIFGAILVVGSGVVLITKKRMK